MLLSPEGTKNLFEKKDMGDDDRRKLRELYGDNKIYYCACNFKVPYKLSKDNRFYPCRREIDHEKNCSESRLYKMSNQRMSAFIEDTDTGKIKAKIIDKTRRNKNEGFPLTERRRKCFDKVPFLSLEGYMEALFLSAYEVMKRSTKFDKKDIFKIAYAKLCATEAVYNGRRVKMKADETPFKIFYGRLAKIEKCEKLENETTCYTLTLNERELKVKEEDLQIAIEKFKLRYKSSLKIPLLCVIRRFKTKYKIEKAYLSDTEIIFYPISNDGCICSSAYQQKVINEIEEMEKGQNAWYFYRPYEYGYGAFGDKYLEDGLIYLRNKNYKICLEFTENIKTEAEKRRCFVDDGKYKLVIIDENKEFNAGELYSLIS